MIRETPVSARNKQAFPQAAVETSTPRRNALSGRSPLRSFAPTLNADRASRRHSSEGGFVLLTLLFFAAAVAFTLVIALPRVSMQSQRAREETLIYRGEQYKRAVQLYFRKYKKYPESLDDLEETDGIRFLRRRYKDPLTGEDEWRLVHMGSDGRFKDSLLYDQEEEEDAGRNPYARRGTVQRGSAGAATAFRGADLARSVRQSAAPDLPGQNVSAADYLAAGLQAPGEGAEGQDPAQSEQSPDGSIPYPNYRNTLPSQIPSPTGAGAPVNTPGAAVPYPGMPGVPPQTLPSNRQSSNRAGLNRRQQPGGAPPVGIQPGMAPGATPAGVASPAAGRSAADLIRNLLTTPRPGGLAGLRSGQAAARANQPSFAEGIAGVASKVEQRGIKIYNEREYYNEWEFVYDYRQDASMAGIMGGVGSQGNIDPSQPGIGPGGGLQINPGQIAPTPGMPGYVPGAAVPGAVPADGQPGAYQPQPGQPGVPTPGVPAPPGTSPFNPTVVDPTTGLPYPQPGQPAPGDRSGRNTRGRRTPPPLPGQPIYPGGAADPTQPTITPGQSPFGQPPADPNQPGSQNNSTQQQP